MTSIPKFYTAYDRPKILVQDATEPSRVQEHFRDQCNINTIMEKYRRTGILTDPMEVNRRREALFGDFSGEFDYLTAQNQIVKANEAFMELPARIRKRFNNDPSQLLAFMENPENLKEAVELGLAEKPIPEPLKASEETLKAGVNPPSAPTPT